VREARACPPSTRAAEAKRSIQQTLAVSEALIRVARTCTTTAASLCSDATRLRIRSEAIRRRQRARRATTRQRVMSFALDGIIESHPVHAEWRDNRLVADPLLLERAELLVDLQEQFLPGEADAFTASLTGPAVVALLTLMRACDRVRGIDVLAPRAGPGPGGGLSGR
jgi:hypothetical protein